MTYKFDDDRRFTMFAVEPGKGSGTEDFAHIAESAAEEEEENAAGSEEEKAEHA